MPLGSILIIVGFLLVMLGFIILINASTSGRRSRDKRSFGGVVLIGPLPLVFGSSQRIVRLMIILALVFVTLLLIFNLIPTLAG
ncbi:MAG: DUF131 domain-containing protein [Candidatus Bathyarchaeia archaeon]